MPSVTVITVMHFFLDIADLISIKQNHYNCFLAIAGKLHLLSDTWHYIYVFNKTYSVFSQSPFSLTHKTLYLKSLILFSFEDNVLSYISNIYSHVADNVRTTQHRPIRIKQ